jgi:leader peptidase (prepilin peptidase) / N-methyltransferase
LFNEPFAGGDGDREPRFRTSSQIREALAPLRRSPWLYATWGAAIVCAVVASALTVPGLSGLFGGCLAAVMIAIAAVDAREFRIPDRLVLIALALGLAAAATAALPSFAAAVLGAAARAALVALVLFGFRLAYRRIRGREGLGLGDVKLGAVAGMWLGWTACALAIDFAALAALAAVLVSGLRGQRISGTTRVPFGLFFAPAIWAAWLFQSVVFGGIF